MATIEDLKELETPETPIFLFECRLTSGDVYRWSTHHITVDGNAFAALVLKHNAFELRSSSEDGTDAVSKISLTLANADAFLSPIERTIGWKGAQITVNFLFFDLMNGVAASNQQVVFRGTANPPDESTESYIRLSFTNRLSLQRIFLPETRIQKRCPWSFPGSPDQQLEAINGGEKGKYSPFFRCGYSAAITNGLGNLSNGAPFTSCDYSRESCAARGMFDKDSAGNSTRRFGGIEFVPASILVRGYGEKGSHVSNPVDNTAQYNDFVPLIYGTGWYMPPIVFARNDGNLTHAEVLLGAGEITSVIKVIVNGVEIPAGVQGANMTSTGWYNIVTLGTRTGSFNSDFTDPNGQPVGDPYGSLACLSVVVPNRIADGRSLPQVEVLVQGLKLARFDESGTALDEAFTNNPAWVLLDILRRSGWVLSDIDLGSFSAAATRCDELVSALDLHGNATLVPRFQCNLLLTKRRSAADVVRGIRTGSGLFLNFNNNGFLQVRVENTVAVQQAVKPAGSNSSEALNGGWPAYEFGDNGFSGIVRQSNGKPAFRTWSRPTSDSPNRYTVEFQDEFNEYQQDSLSLVDIDDAVLNSQEISASLTALGIPNYDQATRVTQLQLSKSIKGNTYVDFETSVRAVDLRPGDLITISYAREGWERQPFRVIRISPASSYRTVGITAQIHDDEWYTASGMGGAGSRRQPEFGVGIPRPLIGTLVDEAGEDQFGIEETDVASSDGGISVELAASFIQPSNTQASGTGIPLVGLNSQISTSGGTLKGGQNLYYGLTSVDGSGAESGLSFLVHAAVPTGTVTNAVELPSLSFPKNAAGFNVYRGTNAGDLLRIASLTTLAPNFTDSGLPASLQGPPDTNFDHANFYWRMELQPEEGVDVHSPLTVGNSTLHMLPNEFSGSTVRITRGLGMGQERTILGNSATTITVSTTWDIEPDGTSYFAVSDSSWQFGATGATSPVSFEVPNRTGTTIQISGRSANVRNEESAYGLSPLTRWAIRGMGGTGVDSDVPPAPTFDLSLVGQGSIEVAAISFTEFQNYHTITAGTLTIGYWNELQIPPTLTGNMDDSIESLSFSGGVLPLANDLIQIDSEVMTVQEVVQAGNALTVRRGAYDTTASAHASGSPLYVLERRTFIMPFARGFFGSPASGSYAFPVFLPDARIATAELFMTNSHGNGDVTPRVYTGTEQMGLRTLSGGQLSIQVEGVIATQTDAAPPLSVDTTRSIRDVFATVGTAPLNCSIELVVTQNGDPLCALTIPSGQALSNSVGGFSLGPLTANSLIRLNINLNVPILPDGVDWLPGSDLTVTIRL